MISMPRKRVKREECGWWEIVAGRISLHLRDGQWDLAEVILKNARLERAGEEAVDLDSSIAQICSTRTANILIENNYHTIGDVCSASDEELGFIRGLGDGGIAEVRGAIAAKCSGSE